MQKFLCVLAVLAALPFAAFADENTQDNSPTEATIEEAVPQTDAGDVRKESTSH